MQLYNSPISPYVRKIHVLLAECGQSGALELIAAGGTPTDTANQPLAQNPLGKIPVLVTDDGRSLFDSRVITRFLDHHFNAGLYPSDDSLWDALTLEATADGMTDAALLMVYEGRIRPQELHYAPWVEGQWLKIARALDSLEANMDQLAAPLHMGHIALGCALSYLDLRHNARAWRENHPKLAAWYEEFAARPSMQSTQAPS